MRAIVTRAALCLLLAIALLSGCLDGPRTVDEPVPSPHPPSLACVAPCERPAETDLEKSFEPDLAVSPLDPDHWVIATSAYRTEPSGIGHRSMRILVTTDAGSSWSSAWLTDALDVGPAHPMASCTLVGDPLVAFASDGSVLVAGIAGQAAYSLMLFTARSTDGGHTFAEFQVVEGATVGCGTTGTLVPPSGVRTNDKPALATGPNGTALLAWRQLDQPGAGERFLVSDSVDSGTSWSAPRDVPMEGGSYGGAALVLEDARTWAMSVYDYQGPVWFVRTTDGGASWSRVQVGSSFNQFTDLVWVVYEGEPWHHVAFSSPVDGAMQAVVAWSRDEGQTWSEPLPLAAPGASLPTVATAADGNGTVYVAYNSPSAANDIKRLVTALAGDTIVGTVAISETRIEIRDMDTTGYGHYFGADGRPDGMVTVWAAGGPAVAQADLYSAHVRFA